MSTVHHFQQFVIIDAVLQILGNCLEFLKVNDAVLVLVKNGEHSLKAVLGFNLADLGAHEVDEFVEADGFSFVSEAVDELQDEGVSAVDSQLLEDLGDFNGINGSTAVLVKHFEGLLEFVVVLGGKSVSPVGGRSSSGLFDVAGCGFGRSAHNISNISNALQNKI